MLRVLILSALFTINLAESAASMVSSAPSTPVSARDAGLSLAQAATDVTARTTSAPGVVPSFDEMKCRRIADLSSPSRPVFIEKPDGEWECSYQLEYTETGHTPSVFLQIRGFEPGVWSSFRLKLNFGSILSRQVLGDRAASLVYALIGDQTPMRELSVTLGAGHEFEASFEGITLRYRQERFDTTRYNLSGTNRSGRSEPPLPKSQQAPAP